MYVWFFLYILCAGWVLTFCDVKPHIHEANKKKNHIQTVTGGCQNQHKTQTLRSQRINTASIDYTESVTLEHNGTRGYTLEEEHRLNNNSYKIHIFNI
jgi:hypothetical protein